MSSYCSVEGKKHKIIVFERHCRLKKKEATKKSNTIRNSQSNLVGNHYKHIHTYQVSLAASFNPGI